MKKVIVQFNIADMTAKQYDQAWEDLRAAGQSHPLGLLHHVGGGQGGNWIVIEVWETEEAFNKYCETLMPILVNLGIAVSGGKPVITALHYEYIGLEAEVTY